MGRKLSGKQWVSIAILTLACVIQKMHPNESVQEKDSSSTQVSYSRINFGFDLVLIFTQVRIEKLQKTDSFYLVVP